MLLLAPGADIKHQCPCWIRTQKPGGRFSGERAVSAVGGEQWGRLSSSVPTEVFLWERAWRRMKTVLCKMQMRVLWTLEVHSSRSSLWQSMTASENGRGRVSIWSFTIIGGHTNRIRRSLSLSLRVTLNQHAVNEVQILQQEEEGRAPSPQMNFPGFGLIPN